MYDFKLENFIEDLSSDKPSPGGGGVSALLGVLACSLGEMVGNITLGNEKYKDNFEQITSCLDKIDAIKDELLNDIILDEECFLPLAEAYKMPSNSDEEKKVKENIIQNALIVACKSPVKILTDITSLVDELEILLNIGSKMVISDIGVALNIVKACVNSAAINIFVNTKLLKDDVLRVSYNSKTKDIVNLIEDKCDKMNDKVEEYLF